MIDKELPKTFCSVPWLQIHTEPDGKIFPCCYYSHEPQHHLGNWNKDKVVDTFHNKQWNDLRKEFLDGKRPSACTRCWKEEDSGITSMRERFNERYSNFPDFTNQNGYDKFKDIFELSNTDGSVGDIKLATIDLIFNNLCNFKCRSCGPGLSTSWVPDAIKIGKAAPNALLTNSQAPHMAQDLVDLVNMCDPYTEVHFSGGEPMMQEEHYEFLKLLVDMGKTKVKIRYNTNLSTYKVKDYDAFELLKHFENVFIIGSIDAMGAKGEYIRKGFDWEQALNWIKLSKERLPKADYGISAVYSIYNVEAAIDLHKFTCESELFTKHNGENFGFYLNVLHAPYYMKTTVLPKEMKERVTEKINKHIEWLEQTHMRNFDYEVFMDHWKNAAILMNSADDSHHIPDFYRLTKQLDDIRNESFEETFPELHEGLKKYGKL